MKEETIYNANNILAFNLPTNWFATKANEVFTEHLQKALRDKITKLHNINKQIIFKEATIPKNGINETLLKFKEAFEANNRNSLTNSELRTLTYYLDYTEESISAIFSNQEEVKFLTNTLSQRWKDSFFIGIFSLLLKKWNSKNTPSFNLLYEFLTIKIEEYSGNRKLLLNIKNNNRYFEKKDGITRLINMINNKNIGINGIAVADYIELPTQWFSINHEYFENLVFDYCEKKQNNIDTLLLKEIETILTNVAGHYFNKKILCRIIKYTNNTFDEQVKEEVKRLAFTYIGDPAEKVQWLAWEGANEEEATELEEARRILNEWITTQFIIVFFEKCINDERRKAFWLKMSKHISSFKVFGSEEIREELRKDKRIGDFVTQRFKTTGSQKKESAFLMVVHNYQLIEFSNSGNAFYAYHIESEHRIAPDKQIYNINQLKKPDLGQLLYANGDRFNNGNLKHNDNWEENFAYWLKIQLNIHVNP